LQARCGADAGVYAKGASRAELQCVPGTTTLWLELRIAAEHEAVVHLDDLLLRRTRLGILLPHGAITHIDKIRTLCQPALQWDDATWQAEIKRYVALIDKFYSLPKMSANPSK
jgi:glycerol-3-phosphate dehydrogenase